MQPVLFGLCRDQGAEDLFAYIVVNRVYCRVLAEVVHTAIRYVFCTFPGLCI